MATELETQTSLARERIVRLLKRVPDRVNNGSYNLAVEYKAACKQAAGLLAKKSPKYADLQRMANQLDSYNRG